jgi:hypothetical protein
MNQNNYVNNEEQILYQLMNNMNGFTNVNGQQSNFQLTNDNGMLMSNLVNG